MLQLHTAHDQPRSAASPVVVHDAAALPQHLPRQVFGLVNSYVLHKITDPQVVSTLERTVSGIENGLWRRLSGLAPGQAIVSFPHMTRPLLVTVDPTPARLRLGPGRRGDCSPRLPQIRTCPIKASGSSSHGLAADGDTRWDG